MTCNHVYDWGAAPPLHNTTSSNYACLFCFDFARSRISTLQESSNSSSIISPTSSNTTTTTTAKTHLLLSQKAGQRDLAPHARQGIEPTGPQRWKMLYFSPHTLPRDRDETELAREQIDGGDRCSPPLLIVMLSMIKGCRTPDSIDVDSRGGEGGRAKQVHT